MERMQHIQTLEIDRDGTYLQFRALFEVQSDAHEQWCRQDTWINTVYYAELVGGWIGKAFVPVSVLEGMDPGIKKRVDPVISSELTDRPGKINSPLRHIVWQELV